MRAAEHLQFSPETLKMSSPRKYIILSFSAPCIVLLSKLMPFA